MSLRRIFPLLKKAGQAGFTGIELLIVLTIAAVVTILVASNIQAAVAKGRDIERRTDLNDLQRALEEYWHTNEAYPSDLNGLNLGPVPDSSTLDGANDLQSLISQTLIDPNNQPILILPATDSANKPASSYQAAKPDQEYTYAPYDCDLSGIAPSSQTETDAGTTDESQTDGSQDETEAPAVAVGPSDCKRYVIYSWLETANEAEIPYELNNLHNPDN